MQLGYLGHMVVILPSTLFWFPKWPLSKMQQAENYMMLPPENIAQAMFELNFWMITLEFSRDRSASHLPLQFLVFLRTSRTEIYSSGTQCSLFPWWFSSDRRAIHERTPQITIYTHVQMFLGGLSFEMNRSQGTIETAAMLWRHSTNQLLVCIIRIGEPVKGETKTCTRLLAVKEGTSSWFRFILCVNNMPHFSTTVPFETELVPSPNELIRCTHMLLPYDPGGLALHLDEIGGIQNSSLIIIGLGASRFSREGECNTPCMGCCHVVCTCVWATRWAKGYLCVGLAGVYVSS